MKRLFKWVVILLGIAMLLGASLAVQVIFFWPFDIRVLYETLPAMESEAKAGSPP